MSNSWKLEQGVWGGGTLSPLVGVLGGKAPKENFTFSKDARLAKTGKKYCFIH